jgi:hypothetical protein
MFDKKLLFAEATELNNKQLNRIINDFQTEEETKTILS